IRGGLGKFYAYPPVVLDLTLQQNNVLTQFPTISVNSANDPGGLILRPDVITDSEGNLGIASLSAAGRTALNTLRDQILAGSTFKRNPWVDSDGRTLPYTGSWSLGVTHQIRGNSAVSVDYVANSSHDQLGVIDINEPTNRVRPGVNVFDPTGELIPAEARNTPFARVLQVQTNPVFDGNYKSLQLSYNKRMSNRWSGRLADPLQQGHHGGLRHPAARRAPESARGSHAARRVWLDYEPEADFGRFASDRRNVLAASGTWNPWK